VYVKGGPPAKRESVYRGARHMKYNDPLRSGPYHIIKSTRTRGIKILLFHCRCEKYG